ncbi:hypothetical protein CDV31_008870 [Fusarium ambrosium]|uniref:BHLH domain-containing protein n=1 Tax=Fusarium ambrosium TaxID=131363 RepID=A0A428TY57_9HYPO|nr:hypothetical protein CDV31_008870 [Fusarium ambrosium]
MMSSAAWDGQDQAMTSTTDEEFHQFINMASLGDGMHFDFQGFPDGSAQGLMNQPRDAPDTIMTDTENPGLMSVANSMPMSTSTGQPTIPAHMMTPASDPISNIDAQIQYLQQQKFQQQQRQLQEQQAAFFHSHNHSVPPTPQSLEMPNSGQFYSQAEQVSQSGVYDRGYQRMKDQQDMAFTPLVSPAVTPLDPGFPMSDSFVTNPYFSPLTSPALIPQNDHSVIYNTNSPIEMDPENPARPGSSVMDLSKKTRRKAAAKSSRKGSVRSSPIVKPQRQKIRPSPAIVSQVLNEVDESIGAFLPMPATSTETSAEENSSVSPEALTDMPPPPIPNRRSTSKSPYIQAQMGNQQTPISAPVDSHPAPATPASLMKLPASKAHKQAAGHHEPAVSEHIESLELPESVSGGKTPAPVASRVSIQSPIVEPNPGKGSGFQPLPSPVFPKPSGPASASASPQLAPGSTGPSARKTPQLAPRSSRKRSTGSVHVSPALLPRISPSIKPLLPGTPGMTSAESAASQLLMSKSNYQNILEGNKVPGVSYPSELSTNLTSKRTSHKIAEQGRRNRINSALQVMAGLLPGGDKGSAGEDGDKKDGKQANAQNSKASVVENAIVHLKNLEQENVDLKKEVEELKKRLEGLKGTDSTE